MILDRRQFMIGCSAAVAAMAGSRVRALSFLADDQKRWSTHMLLRDEQWREHDRLNTKQVERLDQTEVDLAALQDQLRHLQAVDVERMQSLLGFVRSLASEYEQNFTKTA